MNIDEAENAAKELLTRKFEANDIRVEFKDPFWKVEGRFKKPGEKYAYEFTVEVSQTNEVMKWKAEQFTPPIFKKA